MVLGLESLVGLPVHPFGLLRERLHHVSAPSEALSDLLGWVQRLVHLVVPPPLVRKVIGVLAQERLLWLGRLAVSQELLMAILSKSCYARSGLVSFR